MIQKTTQFDEGAPLWCRRLISEIDAADKRATALTQGMTPHQLNWKPSPDQWSVGQCIEHLCVTNEVYCAPISRALLFHPPAVVQEITPGWFGRWFIRNYVEPSPKAKRRAPKKIRPGGQVDPSILDRFLASNYIVRELVQSARDFDVNRIRFRNPFVPVIRFTVGTGLEILSKHQQRHLQQAERIRESPEFPAYDSR